MPASSPLFLPAVARAVEPFFFIFASLVAIALVIVGVSLVRKAHWWMEETVTIIAIVTGQQ
jgi:hypothetical protein